MRNVNDGVSSEEDKEGSLCDADEDISFSESESSVVNVYIEPVISLENSECTSDHNNVINDKEDNSDLSSVEEAGPTCWADEATEAPIASNFLEITIIKLKVKVDERFFAQVAKKIKNKSSQE